MHVAARTCARSTDNVSRGQGGTCRTGAANTETGARARGRREAEGEGGGRKSRPHFEYVCSMWLAVCFPVLWRRRRARCVAGDQPRGRWPRCCGRPTMTPSPSKSSASPGRGDVSNGDNCVLCGVWCGVVYGVVWCGVVWCGVVWRGGEVTEVVRAKTTRSHARARCNAAPHRPHRVVAADAVGDVAASLRICLDAAQHIHGVGGFKREKGLVWCKPTHGVVDIRFWTSRCMLALVEAQKLGRFMWAHTLRYGTYFWRRWWLVGLLQAAPARRPGRA